MLNTIYVIARSQEYDRPIKPDASNANFWYEGGWTCYLSCAKLFETKEGADLGRDQISERTQTLKIGRVTN